MTTANIFFWFATGLLPLSLMVFLFARQKAYVLEKEHGFLHSRPGFYGWYAVIKFASPALIVGVVCSFLSMFNLVHVPGIMILGTAFALGGLSLWFALKHIKHEFRARQPVEKAMTVLLFIAAMISILTTLGIGFSVIFESIRCFHVVSFWDFVVVLSLVDC